MGAPMQAGPLKRLSRSSASLQTACVFSNQSCPSSQHRWELLESMRSSPCDGHAGIGRSISRVDQIDALKRPLTMEEGGVVLMDLLWSDPTTNDGVEGVQPSPRGPGLVTFGPDRVKEFCKVGLTAAVL